MPSILLHQRVIIPPNYAVIGLTMRIKLQSDSTLQLGVAKILDTFRLSEQFLNK